MACLVCEHSKRWEIEEALRTRKSKAGVAKEFGIARSTLQYHLEKKHEEKNPAKPPPKDRIDDSLDPFPNEYQVKYMETDWERQAHVERLLTSRKYKGTETIAYLARLWRPRLGCNAEDTVALYVANAARKHRLLRGPKDVRKELAVIELLSMHAGFKQSGDNKSALASFQAYIELDDLKEKEEGVMKQLVLQIAQFVKVEAPSLAPKIDAMVLDVQQTYEHAKAIVEGDVAPQIPALHEADPDPVPEAPPTPRSEETSNAGIDTGRSSSKRREEIHGQVESIE